MFMESYFEKPVLMVNNLISALNKGYNGFTDAVDAIENQDLKKLFNKIREKKSSFIESLKKEIQKYNGEVKIEKVTTDNNFEMSINDSNVKDKNKTQSILEYCEKLEYSIQMEYANAVGAEIPGETKDVITGQYNEIRDFHDQLKILIEREKKSKE